VIRMAGNPNQSDSANQVYFTQQSMETKALRALFDKEKEVIDPCVYRGSKPKMQVVGRPVWGPDGKIICYR